MSDRTHRPGEDLAAVETRLRELRRRKKVRWTMSQQTAEMAIAALALEQQRQGHEWKRTSKSRRRKRGKRLL